MKHLSYLNNENLLREDLHQKLVWLMEEEQVYKNPTLDLERFSSLLGVSKRKTSQLINRCFHESFTTFMNRYRLREVLQKIHDKAYVTHTITGIAMEAGFPSKSTFYRVFKNRLGTSPSSYLKKLTHD